MTQPINKPAVCICADGTLVFNAAAVATVGLRDSQLISICYIESEDSLYIGEMPEGPHGTRLEATGDGGLAAYRAADFLHEIRPLPRLSVVTPHLWTPPPKGVSGKVVVLPIGKQNRGRDVPVSSRTSLQQQRTKG